MSGYIGGKYSAHHERLPDVNSGIESPRLVQYRGRKIPKELV